MGRSRARHWNRLLEELYEAAQWQRFIIPHNLPFIEIHVARVKARLNDVDGAIELSRKAFDNYFRSGEFMWLGAATAIMWIRCCNGVPRQM